MGARILVIEDNAANMELMAYLLQSFGHTVLTATDGAAGLEAARRELPDVILCDLQMPVMDGFEVARQLGMHETLNNTPLVAVSASATDADRGRALAGGFDAFITKPIEPGTFVQEVEAFLPSAPGGA